MRTLCYTFPDIVERFDMNPNTEASIPSSENASTALAGDRNERRLSRSPLNARIDRDVLKRLRDRAKEENRTTSNMTEVLLDEALQDRS